jgi:tetratricopeptide (TPR) repeat protein
VSPQTQAAVTLSCHQTLIYLGDLFRYRAAERLDKEPDWGPAIGYYALAASLRPDSGLAFHQQSVVAFEQGDYLRSTYYLYRSINVDEPHPNAIPNQELQFKKITTGWQKGDLVPKNSPQDPVASRKALLSWFIRFHSLSYNGQHFTGYDELEREVLSRTVTEIKARALDGVLSKMALINFCAQATAGNQFESKPDQHKFMQSYFFFLRLNVKFFTAILEVYRVDLEKHLEEHTEASSLVDKLTDLARHVLPALRLYSTWLLSNAHIVAARVGDEPFQKAMDYFWHIYAKTLSVMAFNFSFRELGEVPYQLEEDVDAFGLKPLNSDKSRKLWVDDAPGKAKAKHNDEGINRLDSNQEMLGRVRELLFDALLLAVDKVRS